METLNLKRPAKEYGKFKYFKNKQGNYEAKENLSVNSLPDTKLTIPRPKLLSQINHSSISSNISKTSTQNFANTLNSIISKLNDVEKVDAASQAYKINRRHEEITRQVKETQEKIEEVLSSMKNQTEESLANQEMFNKSMEEIFDKINQVKSEKAKIEEKNDLIKKNLKFFKDFSNLEILDVLESPKGINIRVKHESNYLQFSLIEVSNNYEYHLYSTSIPLNSIPEIFKEDIVFEKTQFKLFYLEIIEYLFSFG
jgi:paraquat-inducible protein B